MKLILEAHYYRNGYLGKILSKDVANEEEANKFANGLMKKKAKYWEGIEFHLFRKVEIEAWRKYEEV